MSNPVPFIASLAIFGGFFAMSMYLFGYIEGRRVAFSEADSMARTSAVAAAAAAVSASTSTPRPSAMTRAATAFADSARIGDFELMS